MKVSVVIPCYNEAPTIGMQLEVLAAQGFEGSWEVVVADNVFGNWRSEPTTGFAGPEAGILQALKPSNQT